MLQHEILADILLLGSDFRKTAIHTGSGWQQWHRTENLFSFIKECRWRWKYSCILVPVLNNCVLKYLIKASEAS